MSQSAFRNAHENETDNIEVTVWRLVVAVAVLATLMGVIVIAAAAWACMTCMGPGGGRARRRWCEWRGRNRRENAFPPDQREMIELGRVPGSHTLRECGRVAPATRDQSGISRGLGLGVSYAPDQVPALPAPRSWTPSPPFDPHGIHIQPLSQPPSSHITPTCQHPRYNHACVQARSTPTCLPSGHTPKYIQPRITPVCTQPRPPQSCTQPTVSARSRNRNQPPRVAHVPTQTSRAEEPLSIISEARLRKYGSSACTSPFNPRHNTPNTDRSSVPAPSTSSSASSSSSSLAATSKYTNMAFDTSSSDDHSFEVIDGNPKRIQAKPRSSKKMAPTHALPRRRKRKSRTRMSTTEASSVAGGGGGGGGGGGSGGNKRLRVPVAPQRQLSAEKSPSLLRGAASGEIACPCYSNPYHLPRSDNDLPLVSSRSARLRDLTLEPLQSSIANSLSEARRPALRHYNTPVARPRSAATAAAATSSTRALRGVERRSRSRQSKTKRRRSESRSHLRRNPTNSYLGTYLPSSMPHLPSCFPPDGSDADRELDRRLALKYGFCVTCGIYTRHQQRLERALAVSIPAKKRTKRSRRKKSRCTQTRWADWNNNNDDYSVLSNPSPANVTQHVTLSSTPSLSWDNLTPDPSPVLLTDTLGDTGAADALVSHLEAAGAAAQETEEGQGSGARDVGQGQEGNHRTRGRRRSRHGEGEHLFKECDECPLLQH